jgi:hypothetical protein
MKGNGWVDIGYAFGVCPHGEVYEGRGFGRVQAAAAPTPGKLTNGNTRWVNVTFMSGPNEKPTDEQITAFRALRHMLMTEEKMSGAVKGHRDFTSTSCPGKILYDMVKDGSFSSSSGDDDDMPTTKEVWNHEIEVPWGTKENPSWQADSLLLEVNKMVRKQEVQIKELHEKLDALIRLAS